MKIRFSIRELLWFTFIIAIIVAWWSDHQRWRKYYFEAADRATRLAKERDDMEKQTNQELSKIQMAQYQLRHGQQAPGSQQTNPFQTWNPIPQDGESVILGGLPSITSPSQWFWRFLGSSAQQALQLLSNANSTDQSNFQSGSSAELK